MWEQPNKLVVLEGRGEGGFQKHTNPLGWTAEQKKVLCSVFTHTEISIDASEGMELRHTVRHPILLGDNCDTHARESSPHRIRLIAAVGLGGSSAVKVHNKTNAKIPLRHCHRSNRRGIYTTA